MVTDDIDEVLETTKTSETLPEAKMVINIKGYFHGFSVMFTKRSNENSVIAQLDGIEGLIKDLESRKWDASWNKETNNAHKPSPEVSADAPVCGIHGTPMSWKTGVSKKTNKPYAFWGCASPNADGSYCTYKPSMV